MPNYHQVAAAVAVAAFSFLEPQKAIANDLDSLRELQLDLLEKMDFMQQEIQMLRGMVEEQALQIESLQSDGRARYLDLDGRLSALSQRPAVVPGAVADTPTQDTEPAVADSGIELGDPENEVAEYQAAFSLIRERQYDDAILAMERFIQRFPSGKLVADAYFWLGQVFEENNQPGQAIAVFQSLVQNYPEYRRIQQTQLDLGRLQLATDPAAGQATLQALIDSAPDSDAASSARDLIESL